MRASLTFSLVLLLTLPAAADVLLLRGGGRVEGVVTETAGGFEVRSLSGTAVVRAEDVLDRIRSPYVTEEYEGRLARLEPGRADDHFGLYRWCLTRGLRKQAAECLERTIALDPDHEEARLALGHERHEGVWMSREEAREARLLAAGLIPYDGRWFTEEGLGAWLRAKREEELLAEEVAFRRAEREAAELRARAEAERLAREEAERKVVERALGEAEEGRRERERLARENELLRDLVRDLLRERGDGWYDPCPVTVLGIGTSCWPLGAPLPRACVPAWRHGLGLAFRYDRGDFHLRGRVR